MKPAGRAAVSRRLDETPPTIVAFIPARSGSQRVPGKNIRPLGGHPALAYSICAARRSGVFDAVVVATDNELYAEVARHYGAEVPMLRPAEISTATSPDIEWVELMVGALAGQGRSFECFSILRPTSPFRQPATIIRAWRQFLQEGMAIDSLRAVEPCAQHPGKMWVVRGRRMMPLLPLAPERQPFHSSQYAALPPVYVQNASLEIGWTRNVLENRSIAGETLAPFFTQGAEGVDINDRYSWFFAEQLIAQGEAALPEVDVPPFPRERLPA